MSAHIVIVDSLRVLIIDIDLFEEAFKVLEIVVVDEIFAWLNRVVVVVDLAVTLLEAAILAARNLVNLGVNSWLVLLVSLILTVKVCKILLYFF